MSKNTGTSELINYFDLGVNGDVGIAGSLDINTIANATTDTDTFLVSDTGIIKYRTGAQLLSDIGAAPAVAGGYVPYTGATTNVDLGVYNLTTSAIIANGSGSNSGIVHLESNAIHSLVNGYGSIASGTTNQFNLYQTTGAGVFRGAILSLNSITEFATRTFTLPDTDGTIALTSQIPANPVGGTGTTNYLPKFTGSTTIGNSQVFDDGTGVGIGTTIPSSYNAAANDLVVGTTSGNNGITIVGGTTGYSCLFMADGTTGTQQFRGFIQYDHTNDNLEFGTAGSGKITLFSTGNLLVGSPSPISDNGARLQVSGRAYFNNVGGSVAGTTIYGNDQSNVRLRLENVNGRTWELTGGLTGANNSDFTIYDVTASATRMVINSSGNVGIGTESPTFRFEVETSNLTVGRFWSNASGKRNNILIQNSANWNYGVMGVVSATGSSNGDVYGLGYSASGSTAFTEVLNWTSTGNVGIGVTPSSWGGNYLGLQISSTGAFASNGTNGTVLGHNFYYDGTNDRYLTTGAASRVFQFLGGIRFDLAASGSAGNNITFNQAMTITSGGNVLIGTTTDNGARLQVSGTATITGQMQQGFNQLRSSNGTQAGSSTGDIFRFLNVSGGINNGYYSAIFHIYVYDNNTGANSYSATYAVQTTSNGEPDSAFTVLASVVRGINPVSSIFLVNDGSGGAAKVRMTTTATPTSGATYHCSAIGIF